MRLFFLLVGSIGVALPAAAQSPAEKAATVRFVLNLYDPGTGAYRVDAKSPPGLRAVNGAVRAVKYLGGEVPNRETTAAFVLGRYDRDTGAFSEPGGPSDVTITSVGVMAAVEVGLTVDRFPKALDYLRTNAKTFEDVRIGAAAVESLRVKPDWIDAWIRTADGRLNNDGTAGKGDGKARETASVVAMKLRLGFPVANKAKAVEAIVAGQKADGGWGKAGEKTSDLETTYRVMRALMLAKEKPDTAKVRTFLAQCRNADAGYGVTPGAASTLSGVYYFAIITSWLDGFDRK